MNTCIVLKNGEIIKIPNSRFLFNSYIDSGNKYKVLDEIDNNEEIGVFADCDIAGIYAESEKRLEAYKDKDTELLDALEVVKKHFEDIGEMLAESEV